jgi:hypothetical protein
MGELSITDWANEIDDGKLHHIGEYYVKIFRKPWQKKNGELTPSFYQWMILMERGDGFTKPISEILSKFEIVRD